MKKLWILPLLALLSGCVTYYYPEAAMEDGVYYAEDDPSYAVYADGYVGAGYYPWYSLDYFYLGYYPYSSYRVSYAYPSGFYFGVGYGFSPWYYPRHYYGYYSPWYASYHHHYYPAWRPYRGYYSHHYGDRHWNKKSHDRYGRDHNGSDRYAGRSRDDGHDRNDRYRDDYSRQRRGDEQENHRGNTSVRRYVTTTPSGHEGDRGVVVRSRGSAKIGEDRLETGNQRHVNAVGQRTVSTPSRQPVYSTRRSGGEVRYRSDSKRTVSRTTPVRSTPPPVEVRSTRPTQTTRREGGEVRYRSGAKQTRSRIEPVDPAVVSRRSSASASPPAGVSIAASRGAKSPRSAATRGPAPVRVEPASGNATRSQATTKSNKASRKAPRVSSASSEDSSGQKSKSRRKNNR